MVPFVIELRLAEHTDVNLRGYLIWVLSLVFAVPAAYRFHILAKVRKEALARRGDVPAERSGVVVSTEQHEMIQLQKSLQSRVAE
jgi:hypothetical protein